MKTNRITLETNKANHAYNISYYEELMKKRNLNKKELARLQTERELLERCNIRLRILEAIGEEKYTELYPFR